VLRVGPEDHELFIGKDAVEVVVVPVEQVRGRKGVLRLAGSKEQLASRLPGARVCDGRPRLDLEPSVVAISTTLRDEGDKRSAVVQYLHSILTP